MLLLWQRSIVYDPGKPVSEERLEAIAGPPPCTPERTHLGSPTRTKETTCDPLPTDQMPPRDPVPFGTGLPRQPLPISLKQFIINVLHNMLKMHFKILDKFELIFYDYDWMRSSNGLPQTRFYEEL